eukprot:ctg_314.g119
MLSDVAVCRVAHQPADVLAGPGVPGGGRESAHRSVRCGGQLSESGGGIRGAPGQRDERWVRELWQLVVFGVGGRHGADVGLAEREASARVSQPSAAAGLSAAHHLAAALAIRAARGFQPQPQVAGDGAGLGLHSAVERVPRGRRAVATEPSAGAAPALGLGFGVLGQ